MRAQEVQDIEIDLFLEAMRRRHGYDFRNYARASLRRRLRGLLVVMGCQHLSDIISRLLWDAGVLTEVLSHLSVPVTEMFRDPPTFLALRQQVVPILASFSQVNIWQAGCATGEEAYSLAIILKEEKLYERAQIYATDINDIALTMAEDGLVSAVHMREYSGNYLQAGGRGTLADYYHARYNFAKLDDSLKKNMVFAHHNLVSDGVFCETQLILCRNVLIYFNRTLQTRVLRLFRDSLVRGGFLVLGTRESLEFSDVAGDFALIDRDQRIYQRRAMAADRAMSPGSAAATPGGPFDPSP